MEYLLGVLYLLSIVLIGYYIFKIKKEDHQALYWKLASSLSFFIIGIVAAFQCKDQTYAIFLLLGLVLGVVGDTLLELAIRKSANSKNYKIVCLVAFLLGYISFSFALLHSSGGMLYILAGGALVVGTLIVIILEKMKLEFKDMLLPVIAYASVLMFFEFQAISWLLAERTIFAIVLNIGSLLFVICDLMLAFLFFKGKKNQAWHIGVLSTYYAAQLCLCTTLLLYLK